MSEILDFSRFDTEKAVNELRTEGAISISRVLENDFREKLVKEAKGYSYKEAPEYVGTAGVRQQIATFYEFPRESLFFNIRDQITDFLETSFGTLSENPLSEKLNFNEMQLQKYEPGSIGITSHRDHIMYKNLICIFYLVGTAKFFICDDKDGTNPRELDATPGNLIILRAPGFCSLKKRPYHFATNIPDERYIFSLRQFLLQ